MKGRITLNVNSAFRSCDNGDLFILCDSKKTADTILPNYIQHLGTKLPYDDGTGKYSIHMSGIGASIYILSRIENYLKDDFDKEAIAEIIEKKQKLEELQAEKEARRRSYSTTDHVLSSAHFADMVAGSRDRFNSL